MDEGKCKYIRSWLSSIRDSPAEPSGSSAGRGAIQRQPWRPSNAPLVITGNVTAGLSPATIHGSLVWDAPISSLSSHLEEQGRVTLHLNLELGARIIEGGSDYTREIYSKSSYGKGARFYERSRQETCHDRDGLAHYKHTRKFHPGEARKVRPGRKRTEMQNVRTKTRSGNFSMANFRSSLLHVDHEAVSSLRHHDATHLTLANFTQMQQQARVPFTNKAESKREYGKGLICVLLSFLPPNLEKSSRP